MQSPPITLNKRLSNLIKNPQSRQEHMIRALKDAHYRGCISIINSNGVFAEYELGALKDVEKIRSFLQYAFKTLDRGEPKKNIAFDNANSYKITLAIF
jgi:hypothetical protein